MVVFDATDEPPGEGHAAIVADEVRFEARDAALLAAIDEEGSINAAAASLERSQARALRRIEVLEDAFGTLVERTRGGSGGGGSRLTPDARALLDRFERVAAAVEATARMHETVLRGTVLTVDGELAVAQTAIGTIRGLHDGLTTGAHVQVRIASDALTVHVPSDPIDADTTSARNRCEAVIDDMESGATVHRLDLHVDGVLFRATVTDASRHRLDLRVGDRVLLAWKATATRLLSTNRPPDG